ncbi:DUF1559 domain-containing protein [bacterium]|nr:MAG: DUF1559 domain-containing protein [bacterium]
MFGRARENGRRTVCLSNQRQILVALQLYESDSAENFPYVVDAIAEESWINRLLPYVQAPAVFLCPTDGDVAEKASTGFTTFSSGVKNVVVPSSYIVNKRLLYEGRIVIDPGHRLVASSRPVATVTSPSTTVFISDGVVQAFPEPPYWTADSQVGCAAGGALYGYQLDEPSQSHDSVVIEPGAIYNDCYAPNSRHLGRVNVGFVDGHVKSMSLAQWYFPNTPFLDPAKGG